ncbi:uncharacterized protein LOC106705401 [Latimeria chalumnae]|uniref:uncharacterized protein LOC106705401 n=1 Tax=Latimeria chalumnae TaxID=7897 RepID=UPI0006D91E57|nr:PREDICTED: uncharacterized protein LOC106705401 [Latimeria chalumnae]|eukprot:XP_014350254.1 PREDICTED: uncharacterized protein LOC106705401 [Latimeria chalumnae]
MVEKYLSSSEMKEAKRIIDEETQTGEDIRKLYEELEKLCSQETSMSVENQMAFYLLSGAARSLGIQFRHTDFIFDELFSHQLSNNIIKGPNLAGIGALTTTTLVASLLIDVGRIGVRTAVRGAFAIAAGAVGLVLSIADVVGGVMDLAKEGTVESEKLKETAKKIQESLNDLTSKTAQMRKEIKMLHLKESIQSEDSSEIRKSIIDICSDKSLFSEGIVGELILD